MALPVTETLAIRGRMRNCVACRGNCEQVRRYLESGVVPVVPVQRLCELNDAQLLMLCMFADERNAVGIEKKQRV